MRLLTFGLGILTMTFSVVVMAKENPHREQGIDICIKKTMSANVTEKQARGYCSCSVEKLESDKNLYRQSEDAYFATIRKYAQECAKKNGISLEDLQ